MACVFPTPPLGKEASRLRASTLSRPLTLAMTVITGAAVANLYYSVPLLLLMARSYHVAASRIGLVPMLTQAGYAAGLVLFVPLGDLMERRRLIVRLLGLVAVALALVAYAPTLLWLEGASFLLGLFTVVPQIIVPLSADLARPDERGRVVGMVMSGLLVGVLLARSVSGLVADALGWRAVFAAAAGLMLALGLVVRLAFPVAPPVGETSDWRALLRSLAGLATREAVLRRIALTGAGLFAAFSAFWTSLTFRLSAAPYHYPASIIGIFGLIGVVGALTAPLAGRRADNANPRFTVTLSLGLVALSLLWTLPDSGRLWGLIPGLIGLDAGVSAAQISNQSQLYARFGQSRSRATTVYMATYFVGGALGAGLGPLAWRWGQWPAVTAVALVFVGAAAAAHFLPTARSGPVAGSQDSWYNERDLAPPQHSRID